MAQQNGPAPSAEGRRTIHVQGTDATEAKIGQLIKEMTLEEKVNMIHASSSFTSGGVPRLGIPELVTSDGPHGVRLEHGRGWDDSQVHVFDSATYFPVGVCLAATWNPHLGFLQGSALGAESNARGKDVQLGPGINIIRTPLNGRNFEYMSEDPYLISRMVVGEIKGMQSQGISACVKHYLANNQEINRSHIDVEMSERALREIYLPGFKAAITEGGANTIMGAYNKFRGQFCTENAYLIDTILKKEWGFKGIVISDWGAVHNTMEALENGTDLEMGTDLDMLPNPDYHKFFMGDTVLTLVRNGVVSQELVDDKVRRILRIMFKTRMMDHGRQKGSFDTREHQEVARKVAEEGIVLLKNDTHILPLDAHTVHTVAVIGANAGRLNAQGGGSSQVRSLYEITPLQGLKNLVGAQVKLTYAQGYTIARGAQADPALIAQAAEAAAHADVAIIVGGWTHGYDYAIWKDNAYDAEDVDKPNMDMPFGQDELIRAVVKANPRTVVVLMGGGPIDMTRWETTVPGILQAWYPGLEGGTALAKILFGEVNPSGKLPMSFPRKLEDVPAQKLGEYPGDGTTVRYNDGIYVGYRYYDTYKVAPLFPFGHGLSYTTFGYSDLSVVPAGKDQVTVRFTVRNTGKRAGSEVAQVYVHEEKCSVDRPEKELKSFEKVYLEPGASKVVTLTLNKDAFQYYSEAKHKWVLEPGRFDFLVGSSSRDIRLQGNLGL
ncbi:glycoside hydrolase family 3 C-terminal domain-containing protein [Dinghuibacter silviterrae]|uniref:glycoside hydrolase family 3 C-terminal domain-containing protein n=1 Tax=Dinghuibacter silviterrae TaxID=1539049 RepID=UPI001B87FC3B|nr:glycoside hydrolase family 3 C-terminal domain-containing protein [Dinghuibacter silviterrae]